MSKTWSLQYTVVFHVSHIQKKVCFPIKLKDQAVLMNQIIRGCRESSNNCHLGFLWYARVCDVLRADCIGHQSWLSLEQPVILAFPLAFPCVPTSGRTSEVRPQLCIWLSLQLLTVQTLWKLTVLSIYIVLKNTNTLYWSHCKVDLLEKCTEEEGWFD